jgi:predicted nuclease of restriction endonuclease-like RecB superfamily
VLLFRLVDLPRRVRRLAVPLPLDPAATDTSGPTGPSLVGWTLEPTLLNAGSHRLRTRVARVIALYAEAEGQPRAVVEALSPRIEEEMGNYRLGRCIARTVEHCAYEFAPPPVALPHEPAALRALCYRRAQEQYGGYVPRAKRVAFLAAVAAELDTTPAQLEDALWADRIGAALLQRRTELLDSAVGPVADAVHPAHVIARYNAAAVATVVAASSCVTLHLAASKTTALKDLYRHARALHVGVDITQRATEDVLDLTLYGPGSRALVRSRAAIAGGGGPDRTRGRTADTMATVEPAEDAVTDEHGAVGAQDGDGAAGTTGIRIPAAGGAPVAAVVTRLVGRHPSAVCGGRMLLVGADGRLFYVWLEGELLAALHAGEDETADAAGEAALYDSAVEEAFARAFHLHERDGRGGLVRGWTLAREPRAVVVEGTVFLPDFIFRRGDVEVYGEVIGFYTADYLARKRRKLAALHGRIALLLIIDRDLAPVFSDCGFPIVTYKAGGQIGVTDVVQALEQAFDPFARRGDRARTVLAHLCSTEGPAISEEDLSVALGCAGRSELLALWADLLAGTAEDGAAAAPEKPRAVAEAKEPYGTGERVDRFPRRYLPGHGLVQSRALAAAQAALSHLLHEAGGPVSLEEALARVRHAGLDDPDEALLERLGAVVLRADLFGEAQVSMAAVNHRRALSK